MIYHQTKLLQLACVTAVVTADTTLTTGTYNYYNGCTSGEITSAYGTHIGVCNGNSGGFQSYMKVSCTIHDDGSFSNCKWKSSICDVF
jgi:hypothetical protein